MKYINKIVFAISTLLILGSCKKMLDIKPVNSMLPVSVEDYEAVLLGGYPRTDFFMRTELLTDNVYANLSTTRDPEKANEPWFVWASSHQASGVEEDPYWGQLYKSIYYANTVLDEFESRKVASDEKVLLETVKGEAYALRAFSYFYLVNLYADVYSAANLKLPGVPMPVSAKDVHENTQNNGRVPLEKVWNQIESDLEKASGLLAGKMTKGKFRFDAVSVKLLQARTYLFTGQYEKAADAASYVIEAKSLFNMNNLADYIDSKSSQYAFSGNFGFADSDYKDEVLFYTGGRANNNIFYYATYMFKPSLELLQLMERDNILDYRKYIFSSFADLNTTDGVQTGPTMYNMYAKQENPSYYIGLKASEAYVIRAEALTRMGKNENALRDINNLLKNRIQSSDFTPLSTSDFSNDELLKRILEERRVELAFDAGLRWFDLRRLGKPALEHTYKNGQTYNLSENDPRYILQIPLSEQLNSPDMPLNPR